MRLNIKQIDLEDTSRHECIYFHYQLKNSLENTDDMRSEQNIYLLLLIQYYDDTRERSFSTMRKDIKTLCTSMEQDKFNVLSYCLVNKCKKLITAL